MIDSPEYLAGGFDGRACSVARPQSEAHLFPERLDDYLGEDNTVRAIDVLSMSLDLAGLGFGGGEPEGDRTDGPIIRRRD